MDDEPLRDLIDEIRPCRHLFDKLLLIQRHVHSLRDLYEVIEACLFGNEVDAVLATLGEAEKTALLVLCEARADATHGAPTEWTCRLSRSHHHNAL